MVKKTEKKTAIKTVSVDLKVWETAKQILKDDLNLGISKYVELQLRSLIRSKSGSYAEFMQGTLDDTFRIMNDEVRKPRKKPK